MVGCGLSVALREPDSTFDIACPENWPEEAPLAQSIIAVADWQRVWHEAPRKARPSRREVPGSAAAPRGWPERVRQAIQILASRSPRPRLSTLWRNPPPTF